MLAQVVLFMKGNPDQPKCGFSQKTVALLKSEGVAFGEYLQSVILLQAAN